MKDIVVLAGTSPWSVLSLCKCAFKHKVKAFVVCVKNGWGRKYAKSRYVYRAFDAQELELDVFWERFFAENPFAERPILYVTSDYVCQIVERNRAFYEEHFDLCMASSYIIKSFIDKNLATVEASKHGLTVPLTQELHTKEDVEIVCRNFTFPVIVKPVTFLDHSKAGFKTQICNTERELREFVPQHLSKGIKLQCQEYIKGEDRDCVFYQFFRDKEGCVTECMGEKTIQNNGIMAIGTTIFDEQLAVTCRSFLKSIDYVGIGGIEFKKYNGKYYFIEMSTRTEGFLAISDMAGTSLADASFLAHNGINVVEKKQKELTQYMVFQELRYNKGWVPAINIVLKNLFNKHAHIVGAYLDFCFSIKLDLRLIK